MISYMGKNNTASILVIDDHVPAVEMMNRLLTNQGYVVYKAYNGHDGLEQAVAHIPDLILLDVMMPEMNGFEVLEHLQQDPRTAQIPVIFITAKDTPADIEQGLSLGAVDYIPKPAEPRELLARARSKIEAKRLRDILQQRTQDLETLLAFSNSLNAHLNRQEVLQLVVEFITQYGYRFVSVYYGTDREQMRFVNDETVFDPLTLSSMLDTAYHNLHVSGSIYLWQNKLFSASIAIYIDERIVGMICVADEKPIEEHSILLLSSMAQQASLALKNAELYELKANYALELERMVAERTQKLVSAQELLIRAEKLASVGRLASAIAHEINNPLTPVVLNLEAMVEDIKNNHPVKIDPVDIEVMYHSAERIRRIVQRILQFIRKGKENSPPLVEIHIQDIFTTLLSLTRLYFEKSRIKVQVDIEEDLPAIYGNPDQLEQVFLNMMLNAQDAMPNGGVLTLSAARQQNSVVVCIADTGVGIAPEVKERLFEPFVSTKLTETGSGLGLFISHEIIQNHHGEIRVNSELGVGTQFYITLPAATTSD